MILHNPFKISSRLLPALEVAGAWLSLEATAREKYGRTVYRWYVDLPDGREFSENDLSGHGGYKQMFCSFLCFLASSGDELDATRHSADLDEVNNLFPLPVAEWASEHVDEITTLQMDLEETTETLIEE
jgi:hypothetical protein